MGCHAHITSSAGSEECRVAAIEKLSVVNDQWRDWPACKQQGPSTPFSRSWSGSALSDRTCALLKPFADITEFYELADVIGQGQSGVVRRVVDRASGEVCACKTVAKSSLRDHGLVEQLRTEVAAMDALSGHPAVVRLLETFEDAQSVHLVMEHCSGGDLFTRMKEQRTFPERAAAIICAKLADVILHCQALNMMHRDLKPENILLFNGESDVDICVADFGIATFVRPNHYLTARNGTPLYVAPEVLDGCYSFEADVWSAGVVLYMCLCGAPPFWRGRDVDVFEAIQTGRVDTQKGPWQHVSSQAKDLVHRMLTVDPLERITCEEILGHPWIQKHLGDPAPGPSLHGALSFDSLPSPTSTLCPLQSMQHSVSDPNISYGSDCLSSKGRGQPLTRTISFPL